MAKKEKKTELSAAQILAQMERLSRLGRAASGSHQLNAAQWEALRYVGRANRISNSPMALSQYLGATKGTISQTVMALVKKGVMSKTSRSGNARSVDLHLTAQGIQLLNADPLAHVEKSIANLGDKTSKRLARGVAVLLETERIRQNQPSFGTCSTCQHFRQLDQVPYCRFVKQHLDKAETRRICVAHVARPM